jgi:hypothetical protein
MMTSMLNPTEDSTRTSTGSQKLEFESVRSEEVAENYKCVHYRGRAALLGPRKARGISGGFRECVRTGFLGERWNTHHQNPAAKRRHVDSPARKCRVGVGTESESRRDDTGSHALSSAPVVVCSLRGTFFRNLLGQTRSAFPKPAVCRSPTGSLIPQD